MINKWFTGKFFSFSIFDGATVALLRESVGERSLYIRAEPVCATVARVREKPV